MYCPVVYIRCLFHMAHHYCQATAGTNVCRILWYTPMRITLWELLRAIWCPLLTLSEFHVCIMMNNRSYLYGPWQFPQKFHVFFSLTAIHSCSSRPIRSGHIISLLCMRSQSLKGLQLVQSYRANNIRPSTGWLLQIPSRIFPLDGMLPNSPPRTFQHVALGREVQNG